jgi:excisionase family DNA binding protein
MKAIVSTARRRGAVEPGGIRAARKPAILDHRDADSSLLLRPVEVAIKLGISRSKVFELLAARELPSLSIGRCTRIPRAQLDEWIVAQVCWQPQSPSGLLRRLRATANGERIAKAQG